MKIVYFGTPKFAADILEVLDDSSHEVVAVYTRPDSASKRGKKLIPCETKILAESLGIPVFSPETLNNDKTVNELRRLDADIFCVAAYGCIFPASVLEMPKYSCINVHASLLPKWRGAAPIERAILAGNEEQGVSIMQMREGLDEGDYCAQANVPGRGKSASELRLELAELGGQLLLESISAIETGTVKWTQQDNKLATYARKIEKSEVLLNPQDTAETNIRRVYASAENAPAKCVIDDRTCRIVEATLDDAIVEQGSICWENKRLLLGCNQGCLRIKALKPDGKKEMDALSFVAGSESIRSNKAIWQSL
jgi:methionyl-tRNA formyltransferase